MPLSSKCCANISQCIFTSSHGVSSMDNNLHTTLKSSAGQLFENAVEMVTSFAVPCQMVGTIMSPNWCLDRTFHQLHYCCNPACIIAYKFTELQAAPHHQRGHSRVITTLELQVLLFHNARKALTGLSALSTGKSSTAFRNPSHSLTIQGWTCRGNVAPKATRK